MSEELARQQRLNAGSRGAWQAFAAHRRALSALVASRAARPEARLAALGAGNCNDLDLAALRRRYAAVDLVDCDGAALAHGLAAQALGNDPGLRAVGGVDLGGLADLLDGWAAMPPGAAEIAACLERLARPAAPLPGAPYDVVLSAGLLSQLVHAVILALGEGHGDLLAVLKALRLAHVRRLLRLAGERGEAILVSDLVSSDTVPDLGRTPPDRLKPRMRALLEAGNFFTGLNPYALLRACQADPWIDRRVGEAHLLRPWLWHLGERRCYLVYAILFLPPPAPQAQIAPSRPMAGRARHAPDRKSG